MTARYCLTLLASLLALAVAAPTAAKDWTVEPGSRLGFVATQGGAPVEGVFERFAATIRFADDDLAGSKVSVEIDIASVNSKSKDRDTAIVGPGLFDAAKWPSAKFETTAFRRSGDGTFTADATLTMRDKSRPVTLPFALTIAPHPDEPGMLRARAQGELKVLRLDYGVGQGVWKDISVVGNEVTITLDLLAKRKAE